MALLPPLPVVVPLAIAGLLLALGKHLPRYVPDTIALLTSLAAGAICGVMVWGSAQAPLVYWFGGWVPDHGHVLGIGFVVDQAGASVAAFIALLFASTLVFAWGYFEEVHAHFHVLMLLFMAGMIGFCLTHDLFNLFVWFEVMSVAAFALTGYELRTSALEGALNFTVVNTIGSYMILGGIGLIYSHAGALDFSALAVAVAHAPGDPVVGGAFALLAMGLLIKAAQVPFHFWLADAHSVAPSPVSVIFSGAMVALGLFGLARLTWAVFSASPEVHGVIRTLLLGMGAASAVVGGAMALLQRHIKRLLAFSTISHAGIMLIGLALLAPQGLAGMLTYLVGHGLVKSSLFMVAGILLATCGGIDEIGLRSRGRHVWPAGVAMAFAGILLAGLPIGLMSRGTDLIDAAVHGTGQHWLLAAIMVGSACTGAAVLRATGRVFLGLGPVAGEEKTAPTEEEQEKADRPLWLMMVPAAFLLLLSLQGTDAAGALAANAARGLMSPNTQGLVGMPMPIASPLLPPSPQSQSSSWTPWLSVALALVIASFALGRAGIPGSLTLGNDRVVRPFVIILQALHSGLIADYVVWVIVGLALFVLTFAAT